MAILSHQCARKIVLERNIPVKFLDLNGKKKFLLPAFLIFFARNYGIDREGLAAIMLHLPMKKISPIHPKWQEALQVFLLNRSSGRARLCAECPYNQGQVDDHHRRGDEPLVSHGHELPRLHQYAGFLRLYRSIGRRLVALCGAGKTAPANGLGAAGLRAGLDPSAAPAKLNIFLLCAYGSVAL
jgi:hypothetical protein